MPGKAKYVVVILLAALIGVLLAGNTLPQAAAGAAVRGERLPASAAFVPDATTDIPLMVLPVIHPKADQESTGRGTRLIGLNNQGQSVGRYVDAEGVVHGFMLKGDPRDPSSFIDIDYPQAQSTEAFAINNLGQVVGIFTDSAGLGHGFLLNGDPLNPEAYRPIDIGNPPVNTYASAINDDGVIAGSFMDLENQRVRGYRLIGDTVQVFDVSGNPNDATIVNDINNEGLIVGGFGEFDPILGRPHTCIAYVLDQNLDPISRFDINNAPVTAVMGINEAGNMTGYYDENTEDDTVGAHGFLFPSGVRSPIWPVDIGEGQTVLGGLNDNDQFVGFYNFENASVGFLAMPYPQALFLPLAIRAADQ